MRRDWKELDQQVTVSGQIRPEDVGHIAAAGFRVVMGNRPDGEEAGNRTGTISPPPAGITAWRRGICPSPTEARPITRWAAW
jgi:sulfide:quinone oxidoreductase